MDLNELLGDSLFFGIALSLVAFRAGVWMEKKWKITVLNALLISVIIIIVLLTVTGISYETYQYGAKYLSFFLTPVTVCLAVPLYKQVQMLLTNLPAVLISIAAGCLGHAVVIVLLLTMFGADRTLILSLLPKSITSAIALGVAAEIEGVPGIAVMGVMIAGASGAVAGSALLKVFRITDPVAQGLALGSSSHAIGTTRAIEMGELQAAMSSLAIVITGLLTVLMVPWIAALL
ncbi:MAG: LrgB family protein [Lachnospiraceae bacterium]|nr:LrgB family protein [Lachnospiraceae bacterium]